MKLDQITLVLLPGLNGTAELFKPLLDIAPKEFKILCISYPPHEIKNYEELTSYVLDKLATVKGEYFLLGESFSGPIAILASQTNPEGLLGTILVATFISAPNLKIGRFLPWQLLFSLAEPVCTLKQLLKPRGAPASILDLALLEVQKSSPTVLAARASEIFRLDIKRELKHCRAPMMYFTGTKDKIVPKRNLRDIVTIKPEIEVIEFNTGHFLLQSAPTEAWAAINKFRAMLSDHYPT